MFLTRISIRQPVFATMVMLAIVIIGLFAYPRIPIEQMPDVDFPVVAITVSYPGASPEAVETDIIEPLEDAIATIAGIDSVDATAQSGSALLVMMFDLSVDSAIAAQDVREKVAQMSGQLPDDAGDPVVLRFDPNAQAMMSLAISSTTLSQRQLSALADDTIAPRLLNIQGVGSATVVGGSNPQLNFFVDPDRLRAFGIGMQEVVSAVAAENRDTPAGSAEYGRLSQSIQVEGRVQEAEGFLDIVVAQRGGRAIVLGDVATLEDGEADERSIALLNGSRAISIDIIKSQGANTVAIAEAVRAEVERLSQEDMPEGVSITIVTDNAVQVEESLHSVQAMLIEGALLATAIVFLFLNSWRSTVITGLTLPISIIGTMSVIYFLGFTLNMMTMMALSLAVGILIDDAIVVRENIMRHLHMGKSHHQAAEDGTNEIGLAVLATTLTIVAVFMPVAFMEGIIGRFFLQFGVTVSVAVLISLFVAFTLDPMLSSVWYDPSADEKAPKGPIWRFFHRFDLLFNRIANGYVALLKRCLKWRKTTLAVAVASFLSSFALVGMVGFEFMPQTDNGEFSVGVETPPGSSLAYTESKVLQAERILQAFPEVERTYATVAGGQRSSGSNSGRISVTMVDKEERTSTPASIPPVVREALAVIPGATFSVSGGGGMGGGGAPVQVSVSGPSLERVQALTDGLIRRLNAVEGLGDVTSSLEDAQPLVGIRVDREKASQLGITSAQLGNAIRPFLEGESVGDWTHPDGRTYTVQLRAPEAVRNDPASLASLPVGLSPQGDLVRLDQVATISPSFGPSEIQRKNNQRTISVSANLSGKNLGEVSGPVAAAIASMDVPAGYTISAGGEQEDLAESAQSAGAALLLAIIFIYLVLASQFGSFLQPVAIMASLPLSLVGVMLGLLVGGSTLNIFSMIGFIMLMGLVVKNAILLVDNANQQMRAGTNIYDALVDAGHTRFRPIIMTTLAMVFGMMPMALNLSGGTGENAPMAHAVIGGLISSTAMTLVVVPVALTYLHSLGLRVSRWFPAPPEHSQTTENNNTSPVSQKAPA